MYESENHEKSHIEKILQHKKRKNLYDLKLADFIRLEQFFEDKEKSRSDSEFFDDEAQFDEFK